MKVLSWNVQGLGQARKQNGLRDVIRKEEVRLCGVFETKCGGHNIGSLVRRVAQGWDFVSNFDLDPRGRMLVLWDASYVDVCVIGISVQHVGCLATCRTSGEKFGVCFVYGLHSVADRRQVWGHIDELLRVYKVPWMVLGDFNCVMSGAERLNGAPVTMYECRDMVDACRRLGLVDTPSTSNNPFTWTNHTVWSKIDRVMVDPLWLNSDYYCHTSFPEMWHLSDHKPGIVSLLRVHEEGRRYFKFFNMWADHPSFKATVQEAWRSHLRGTAQFRFAKLLHGLKGPLKHLNKLEFSHISSRAAEANSAFSLALEVLRQHPDSLEARQHVASSKRLAVRLNEAEASFLGQQAKAKYVLNSDRCTKYFHALMRSNGRRNHIPFITLHDGSRSSSMAEVEREFVGFYKGLFGTEVLVDLPVASDFAAGPRVSLEECGLLEAPVTLVEIKDALWSIGDDKAPGPDGFSARFFKASWDVVGADLCAAVLEFFERGKLLRQLNHTIIALVPKVENPTRVEHFRPIGLCNVVYKIVSKIMTLRLGKCLGLLIDPAQSAFVEGRLMSDNIFLVQELFRRYRITRDTRRCFLNVDLAKAYDTVSWKFLRFALDFLGFPPVFSAWVMECVCSASYSIKINKGLHGFFPGKRGLRQGDPLSPLLFVICMELLSRLLKKETASPSFHFHQHCESLRLSHLIFADDIVLFCRGDLSSVKVFMDCLERFRIMSGLSVSAAKSSVFFGSVPPHEKEVLLAATGFREGVFPFRYLGIPICPRGLLAMDFKPLLDKISVHINAWAKKCLSFAGRRELLASVLQGCEAFWLSILPVPGVVLDRLVAICRGFLWKRPRVRWVQVCMPKKEGGLGLLNLGEWNKSFMLKHFWHILSLRDSLWVRWIYHRYLGNEGPLCWVQHRQDSPLIKAILQARDSVVNLEGREVSVAATLLSWCKEGKFKVSLAYDTFRSKRPIVWWSKVVWPKLYTPKHMFILWLAVLGKLSTYDRLLFLDVDPSCRLCGAALETHDHLFFDCSYSREVWREVRVRFGIPSDVSSIRRALCWLRRMARGSSCRARARIYAFSAAVYYIWHARNACIFDDNAIPWQVVARLIISHVLRLLFVRFAPSVAAAV